MLIYRICIWGYNSLMKVKSLVVTMPPLNYKLPNKKITVSNMGNILLN